MKHVYIGDHDKRTIIPNDKKIIVIGEDIIGIDDHEYYSFQDVIKYKYYFDLLQRINNDYAIVLNEILVTSNRYSLNYNCIKKYVIQTENVIVFNQLPIKQCADDVMILYDFIQDNPFLKESFNDVSFSEFSVNINQELSVKKIELTDEEFIKYQQVKDQAIKSVKRDPDIIPRRLLKYSESCNAKRYSGLDSKIKLKEKMTVGVNNSNVDQFYFSKLKKMIEDLNYAIKKISR